MLDLNLVQSTGKKPKSFSLERVGQRPNLTYSNLDCFFLYRRQCSRPSLSSARDQASVVLTARHQQRYIFTTACLNVTLPCKKAKPRTCDRLELRLKVFIFLNNFWADPRLFALESGISSQNLQQVFHLLRLQLSIRHCCPKSHGH